MYDIVFGGASQEVYHQLPSIAPVFVFAFVFVFVFLCVSVLYGCKSRMSYQAATGALLTVTSSLHCAGGMKAHLLGNNPILNFAPFSS